MASPPLRINIPAQKSPQRISGGESIATNERRPVSGGRGSTLAIRLPIPM